MRTKVSWGNTVHPDNTILKMEILEFDDEESMFKVWSYYSMENHRSSDKHIMKINELTITSKIYVSFEECLRTKGEEEE